MNIKDAGEYIQDLSDYLTALTTLVASSNEDMSAEDLYALLKPAQTLASRLVEANIR